MCNLKHNENFVIYCEFLIKILKWHCVADFWTMKRKLRFYNCYKIILIDSYGVNFKKFHFVVCLFKFDKLEKQPSNEKQFQFTLVLLTIYAI